MVIFYIIYTFPLNTTFLAPIFKLSYIQNRAIMNSVIKGCCVFWNAIMWNQVWLDNWICSAHILHSPVVLYMNNVCQEYMNNVCQDYTSVQASLRLFCSQMTDGISCWPPKQAPV